MKKACILWIALTLVFAGFSVSLAEGSNGNRQTQTPPPETRRQQRHQIDAEELLPNQAKTILIPTGESVWLRFVPTQTDGYRFYSSCEEEDMDPVAYLYDANMELIAASDDESDENVNFSLSCMLESGKTYYFCCESTAEEDGECPVMLTSGTGLIDAEAEDLPESPDRYLTLNVKAYATAGTALNYQWYQELPEDTEGAEMIDDACYQLLEGENREFLILVRPAEDVGYCCKVSDNQGHEKNVFFYLEGGDEEDGDESFAEEDEDAEDEDPEEDA